MFITFFIKVMVKRELLDYKEIRDKEDNKEKKELKEIKEKEETLD